MIRKDVNDALNNLKKESQKKPEEKRTKSKFDDMSPDELLKEINSGKETKPAVKKLKRISPDAQKKVPQPSGKKRIVIGELPDYDAITQQETKTPEEDVKPKEIPEEKTEEQEESKKGFFARVKDLMYVSAEDDEEMSGEDSEESEAKTSVDDINFTVEEIEENDAVTLESINEAMAAINEGLQETEKIQGIELEKPVEQTQEPEKVPEKKPENNSGRRKKKKKKKNNSAGKSETKLEVKPKETDKTKPAP